MAQFFDGINDNPTRKAISRINWTLRGNMLYGSCPNDGLWRAVISTTAEGFFIYRCGKAKKTIEFCTNKDSIELWLTLDNNNICNPVISPNTPQTNWLSSINWQLKGECLKGTCPDNALFRGIVPDAYPKNDLYPSEGTYTHEWGTTKQKIDWFKDDDYFTGEYRIVLILPLYLKKEKQIVLLTPEELEIYKKRFEVYLLKSLYHQKREHITRYIDRFNYDVFQDDRLSPEQGEQLYQYLESCYT